MKSDTVNWDTFDSRTGWIIKAAVGGQGTQAISLDSLRALAPEDILEVPSVGPKRGRLAWMELQRVIGEDGRPFTQTPDGPLGWGSFEPTVRWIVRKALGADVAAPLSLNSLRALTLDAILSVPSVGKKRGRAAWQEVQRVIAKEEGRSNGGSDPESPSGEYPLPPLPHRVSPGDLVRIEDLDPSVAWAVKRLFEQSGTEVPSSISLSWLTTLDRSILQTVGGVGAVRAAHAIAYIADRCRSRRHPSHKAAELRHALANASPEAAAILDSISINPVNLPADFRSDFEKVLADARSAGEGFRWALTASVIELCEIASLDGPTAESFERRRDECFSHRLIGVAISDGRDHRLARIAVFMSMAMSGEPRWSSTVWEREAGVPSHDFVPMTKDLLRAAGASVNSDEWSYVEGVEMLDELLSGATLAAVGARHGLTRERVRQRVFRLGYRRNVDRAATRRRQAAQDSKVRQDAETFIRRCPGCTPAELSRAIGIAIDKAREECNQLDWLTLSDVPQTNGSAKNSRIQQTADRSIQALQRSATLAFPLTIADYAALREQRFVEGPSTARILQIFGSWRQACDAAGVESGKSGRQAGNHVRWSKDEMIETVALFLVDPRFTGRADQYDQWRKSSPARADLPSLSSITNHLRLPWSKLRDRALRLARSHWDTSDGQPTDSTSGH